MSALKVNEQIGQHHGGVIGVKRRARTSLSHSKPPGTFHGEQQSNDDDACCCDQDGSADTTMWGGDDQESRGNAQGGDEAHRARVQGVQNVSQWHQAAYMNERFHHFDGTSFSHNGDEDAEEVEDEAEREAREFVQENSRFHFLTGASSSQPSAGAYVRARRGALKFGDSSGEL